MWSGSSGAMYRKRAILCIDSYVSGSSYHIPGAGASVCGASVCGGAGTGCGCTIATEDIADGSEFVCVSGCCKLRLGVDWDGWNIGCGHSGCVEGGNTICIGATDSSCS